MCGIQMGGYQGEEEGWGFFFLWNSAGCTDSKNIMSQRFSEGYKAETVIHK